MPSGFSADAKQAAKNKAVHKAAKPKQASVCKPGGNDDDDAVAAAGKARGKAHGKGKSGDGCPGDSAKTAAGVPCSLCKFDSQPQYA